MCLRHDVFWNWLCRFSYDVSYITSFYTANSVLFAVFLTFVMVVTLTLYAKYQTKDFTIYGGVFYVLLNCLIFGSLLLIFIDVSFFDVEIPQNVVEFYNNNVPLNTTDENDNDNDGKNNNVNEDEFKD